MAQLNDDGLRRTDASEVRFQETVPDNQKYDSTQGHSITSLPPEGGQDTGFHVDKPISVTETGYGGVSGRGNDISQVVEESRRGLNRKGGESFTDKVKDAAYGVKDLATGKKQQEASVPVVDQSAAHHRPHDEHKEALGDKVKDVVSGQKPAGRGTRTSEGLEEWPANEAPRPLNEKGSSLLDMVNANPNAGPPSATYTDPRGQPIEGPRDDNTKKEGVMSKVMDKFNLGINKDSAQ